MVKEVKKILGAALVIAIILTAAVPAITPVYAADSTYYIDSVNGNDSNDGTSSSLPWRTLDKVNATTFNPGDRILFKAGGLWLGQLYPKGSGHSGNPIIIDMYGTGSKPQIDGSGNSCAVKLYNQEYWEIYNLDVTNGGAATDQRQGIYVTNDTSEQLNHIKIASCNVHDIQGIANGWYGYNAGIVVAHKALYPSNTTVKWDDIVIDGNTITNVDRAGVYVGSVTHHDDTGAGGMWPMFDNCARNTNIIISNNYMDNCGGDGVVIWLDSNVRINNNIVANSGIRSVTAPTNAFPYGCAASAALWGAAIDHVVYEYNEIYNFGCGGGAGKDGTAFDFDTANTYQTIQYNYSHDNTGGFLETCNYSKSGNCVIRYNVINNDSYGVYVCNGGQAPSYGGNPMLFYNNTIYLGNEIDNCGLIAWNTLGSAEFSNNIFYFLGNNGKNALVNSVKFNNNIFYGNHPSSEPSGSNKIVADPLFVDPHPAKIGRASCDGFKLAAGSPAIGAGKIMSNNGGWDFYGNSLSSTSAPNIGAYNGPGLAITITDYVNLARNKSATASSALSGEEASMAVDGSQSTKWCTTAPGVSWIMVDLGASYVINEYVVRHAGANGEAWDGGSVNTRNFQFQVSTDASNWTTIDDVVGNISNITDKMVSATARYVRVYVTNPQTNPSAIATRICEFAVYGYSDINPAAYYKLTNRNSCKVLEVPDSSTSTGKQLKQYTDNGTDTQQWTLVPIGNGYYKLKNKNSGLVVGISGSSMDGYGYF